MTKAGIDSPPDLVYVLIIARLDLVSRHKRSQAKPDPSECQGVS